MKKVTLLFAAALGMFLYACGGSNSEGDSDYEGEDYEATAFVDVDNGADTTVVVTIESKDGEDKFELEIPSWEVEMIEMPYGEYHVKAVTVTDSVIVDEDFKLEEVDYVYGFNLNLTKEDYIVENVVYAVNPTGLENYGKTLTYDGKTYDNIDAYVIEGKLVVPEEWDYNLDEEYPEEIELAAGSTTDSRSKLYRASTYILILELAELFEEYGDESF
ncbi:hypothetical protein K6119_10455 [Paracrocinitomix mangrovi]|uniref:hypothetical protein n=1 Tax=Paracrocinitomix mangrovi TaxID=2862509 RepID=UPI001C8DF4EA|nr:hypothetical protein [Paracrocinitomix mangrovi]UKN00155.1 hypothetical protein K6119_10455 [Paracrocinitomix mangrovi]